MKKMKNTFKKWEISLAIGLVVSLLAGTAAAYAETGLEDKLIRLHVAAASDSGEDQAIKLAVRDEVLSALRPALTGVTCVTQAEGIISGELPALNEHLRLFLDGHGIEQAVTAELRKSAFPTREYATFALPAGPYTALRVTLDGGSGQNWWCVVFPPLCAATAMEALPDGFEQTAGLSEKDLLLITQADETYVVRFKLAEWLGGFRNWAGNR
jgi:stage II sporulation protein R